ncbi:MAG TPA: hypothetical protein DGG94_07200 [Micromonosporaceae bacterium]|nr:hypothetical protein [Micromonosporaceae bacterium]HCU49573.1 hypothetical protein [Micromonosporaceae bacterium]
MSTYIDDRPEGSYRFFTTICTAALSAVRVDAAGLNLTSLRTHLPITVSDGLPTDELQQRLNLIEDGPSHHAAAHDCLILIADLSDPEAITRFPVYASTALAACIRSVNVIPLGTAATRPGTLDLYRYWPQSLSEDDLTAALTFACLITDLLLAGPTQHGGKRHWPVVIPGPQHRMPVIHVGSGRGSGGGSLEP